MALSRHRLAVSILGLLAWTASGAARADRPFGPAETMTWDGKYLGVQVGRASMIIGAATQVSGETVWPILGIVKTDPYFVLFPVKNRFVTWYNPVTRLNVGCEYLVDENHKQRRDRTRYDRAAGKATVVRDRPGEARTEDTYDVHPDAVDLVSGILKLREKKLAVGDKEEVAVFTGKTDFVLKAEVLRKEAAVEVAAGTFDTVVVSVEVQFSGKLAAKTLLVSFSDDERHIPVRLDAEFVFGSFVAELATYQKGISGR